MGIDLGLYVIGKLTDDGMAEAEAFLAKNAPIADQTGDATGVLMESERENDPTVELYSLSRTFSPYYLRGYWPDIYQSILAMQTAFPGKVVYYGDVGQSDYHAQPCDEELIAENWAAWIAWEASKEQA
jgi:hypothetical protein